MAEPPKVGFSECLVLFQMPGLVPGFMMEDSQSAHIMCTLHCSPFSLLG